MAANARPSRAPAAPANEVAKSCHRSGHTVPPRSSRCWRENTRRPRAGGASPRWGGPGLWLVRIKPVEGWDVNTMGAMPSQWPSAPSARVKRRKSFGQVSWSNSCLPWPVENHVSFVVGEVLGAGDLGDGVGVGVPEQVRAVGPDSGDSAGHHPGCEQRLGSRRRSLIIA